MTNAVELSFPIKSFPKKKDDRTWINDDLIAMKDFLKELHRLRRTFRLDENLSSFAEKYSKAFDTALARECAAFYSRRIEKSGNKAKEIWQIVRERTKPHLKCRTDYTGDVKQDNGSSFSSSLEIVNHFNQRFANAAKLAKAPDANITKALRLLTSCRPPCSCSMRLVPFTPQEIKKIIMQTTPKNTKDVYGLSCFLIRAGTEEMIRPLYDFYNTLLNLCSFPKPLKKVKVSPIYKGKGKKEKCSDYRPITIIPATAKVLETGICNRLQKFFISTGALSDKQYAYRAGRSTADLARELVWQVMRAREVSQQVAVISCDLSRAFDVCNHDLIEMKLDHYGVRGPALALMKDFMNAREQTVVAGVSGEIKSDPLELKIGVAQGSCVSNLTFSLLMNDLPECVPDAQLLMYADDVAAIVTATSVSSLALKLNRVASQLATWFRANGLAKKQIFCILICQEDAILNFLSKWKERHCDRWMDSRWLVFN